MENEGKEGREDGGAALVAKGAYLATWVLCAHAWHGSRIPVHFIFIAMHLYTRRPPKPAGIHSRIEWVYYSNKLKAQTKIMRERSSYATRFTLPLPLKYHNNYFVITFDAHRLVSGHIQGELA